MKHIIICISDNDKHRATAIGEYIKRLGKDLEIISLRPSIGSNPKQIIYNDTQQIIKRLSDISQSHNILLSKDGIQITSTELSQHISHISHNNSKICYIIGGPYGIDEKAIKLYIHHSIAWGKITIPHGLAQLILLEQIYRSQTILSGKKYHY